MSDFTAYSEPWAGVGQTEVSQITNALLFSFGDWRRDADAVATAYKRWLAGAPCDRPALLAAYLSALDQEQSAADNYELWTQELEIALSRHSVGVGRR
jgi:hypothetical protein